ncbi:hypothetical protein TNCV_1989301 [Trichonephila clavipes]|nr:hypothetical protein TNCV_1989301 [Trichonephila clavipes]
MVVFRYLETFCSHLLATCTLKNVGAFKDDLHHCRFKLISSPGLRRSTGHPLHCQIQGEALGSDSVQLIWALSDLRPLGVRPKGPMDKPALFCFMSVEQNILTVEQHIEEYFELFQQIFQPPRLPNMKPMEYTGS